jgi:hypothetical protein
VVIASFSFGKSVVSVEAAIVVAASAVYSSREIPSIAGVLESISCKRRTIESSDVSTPTAFFNTFACMDRVVAGQLSVDLCFRFTDLVINAVLFFVSELPWFV